MISLHTLKHAIFQSAALCGLLLCGSNAQAQQAENNSIIGSLWDQGKGKVNQVLDEGKLDMMVSLYTYHGRNTYTAERIAELNEKTFGLGFSKSRRDEKDNEEFIYGLAISDSHFKPQLNAGYGYQWTQSLGGSSEVGLGYTASLISRTDYFKGFPFPVVLPVASIGTRDHKLMFTYVPRFTKNKGNGDVLFIFTKFSL